jgi:3D (Asp-Asp-Asp) domain-containing protein
MNERITQTAAAYKHLTNEDDKCAESSTLETTQPDVKVIKKVLIQRKITKWCAAIAIISVFNITGIRMATNTNTTNEVVIRSLDRDVKADIVIASDAEESVVEQLTPVKNVIVNENEKLQPIEPLEPDSVNEVYLGQFKISAYCHCSQCCGKSDGVTATGTMVQANRTIAVDPRIIPLGSKVLIDGQIYIAEDTGGAIKGNRIDMYFSTHQEALNFGIRYKDVNLIKTI